MAETILIVGPDITARGAMLEVLNTAGYETMMADDFHHAVHLVESCQPSLVITDARLGPFNGLHLVVRGRACDPPMGALVVGDSADPVLESESTRLGAAAYLVKPVEPARLLASVKAALSSRDRRRWRRTRIADDVKVHVGAEPARLIDVSDGGVRLEVASRSVPLSGVLDLELPSFVLSVKAESRWTRPAHHDDAFWCGAALVPISAEAATGWRQAVQTLRGDSLAG